MSSQNPQWVQDSKSFNPVAEAYDTYRPGYPPELIEYILSASGIKPDGRILEIGSGTGIATALFAQRGYPVFCVEPGENLVSVARRKLQAYPQVEFAATNFEAWGEPQGAFDVAISAQAFHWIPKELGYAKAARALKTNGHIALFWNMYPDPPSDLFARLNQAYCKHAPDLVIENRLPYEELIQRREQELAACGFFEQPETRRFPWSARYTAQQYTGLLNTYSDHLRLSVASRTRLYAEIEEVITQQGGQIEKPYVAVVYLARKAG